MNIVEKNQKVTISYILKDSEGNIIEEAPKDNPLTYLHGYKYIIPGLEDFLDHKEEGATYTDIHIPFDKAFGAYTEDLLISVELSELEHLKPLEIGSHRRSSRRHCRLGKVVRLQDWSLQF